MTLRASAIKTSLFVAGPSATLRLTVLAILAIATMGVDERCDCLDPLRSLLDSSLYPLYIAVDLPFRIGHWSVRQIATHHALLQENTRLHREHLLLQGKLQKLAALQAENTRLRQLLHASARLEDRVLIAEILTIDLDPYRQQILINKGSGHGVYVGQSIVDAYGIMGQIIQANPLHARAMLISDPNHALPVQINRNGLRALALGIGNPDVLTLRHIPATADIHIGDVASTSGLGRRFPPDYPVAEVVEIKQQPGEPFAEVILRPYAHLDHSREILLVWPPGYGKPAPPPPAKTNGQTP